MDLSCYHTGSKCRAILKAIISIFLYKDYLFENLIMKVCFINKNLNINNKSQG